MDKAKAKLSSRLESKALPIVMLTLFLDVLGVGIMIPVLPQLIFRIFMPAGYTLNQSYILLGWLTAIFPIMQFIATPILGQLSDRYGRKPILCFSLLGTAVGYVLLAIGILTKDIPLIFAARAFDGITGGNISVARAVIADASTPEHRTRNFGLIGAAFGIGFVMGPYIGARLATPSVNFFGLFHTPHWFSTATPFWFTAGLSLITASLVLGILPETNKHINRKLKMTWNKSIDNIHKAFTNPALKIIFASEFLFWGGFTFFTTFFQVFLIQKLHFKTNNIGDFFAYIGICLAVTQGFFTPFLAKRFKNYQVLKFSLLAGGAALFLQLWPHSTGQLLLVAPLLALFIGLTMANATTLVSLSATRAIMGEVLGIEASVQALAQAIPAAMAGYVATMGINVPVIVGGSVIMVGGLVFNLFYKPTKEVIEADSETAMAAMGQG